MSDEPPLRGADHTTMREVNRSLVLDLVKAGGRVSRASIARATTLAKPTVSAIVDELIADGLIREVGVGVTAGGRPPILLEFNARSQVVAGVHLGARRTTIAVGDASGVEIARRQFATPVGPPEATLRLVASEVRAALASVAAVPLPSRSTPRRADQRAADQRAAEQRDGEPPATEPPGTAGPSVDGQGGAGPGPGDARGDGDPHRDGDARRGGDTGREGDDRLAAVGVVLPGLTDFHTGVCLLAPNLGWRDVPVGELLTAELAAPVYVHNAGQAAAVAENLEGAGGRVGNLALLYAGTGLSAGVLSDGRVLHGVGGTAGEIGHCALPGVGEPCTCGRTGCLETVASARALVRSARRSIEAGRETVLPSGPDLDAREIATAARNGDPVAVEAVVELGEYLGLAASWLINAYNPAMVVLGGGLSAIGEPLLGTVRRVVAERALAPALRDVEIRGSQLGADAELRGAVLLALQHSETYYRVVFRA